METLKGTDKGENYKRTLTKIAKNKKADGYIKGQKRWKYKRAQIKVDIKRQIYKLK